MTLWRVFDYTIATHSVTILLCSPVRIPLSDINKKAGITNLQMFVFPASGGEDGIRTHVRLPSNGFQDRLVVTASIPLRIVKKCVAVFVRRAKWFCFAAFGRQPEMRLRNLYGIMPAACGLPACGLPACGRLLTCRFSIANAAWFVKIPDNRKPKAAARRGFRSEKYSVTRGQLPTARVPLAYSHSTVAGGLPVTS